MKSAIKPDEPEMGNKTPDKKLILLAC